MALTAFQRDIIRLLASSRRDAQDGYVAGAVALNTLLGAARGKDPGLSPGFIMNGANRTGRYTEDELAPLAFEIEAPSTSIGASCMARCRRWRAGNSTPCGSCV